MTNLTALCPCTKGTGSCMHYVAAKGCTCSNAMSILGCMACQRTGYQHPWVAPLLAECPNHCLDGIYRADLGRGEIEPVMCKDGCTGKRYPQLWVRCSCNPDELCRETKGVTCQGSGWVPNITTAGLLELLLVEGEIGDSMTHLKLAKRPHGYSAWMVGDIDHRGATLNEALGKAVMGVEEHDIN